MSVSETDKMSKVPTMSSSPIFKQTSMGRYSALLPNGAVARYYADESAVSLWGPGGNTLRPPAWTLLCSLEDAQRILSDVEEWDSNHYAQSGTQVPAIVAFVEGLSVFEETWGHPCDS